MLREDNSQFGRIVKKRNHSEPLRANGSHDYGTTSPCITMGGRALWVKGSADWRKPLVIYRTHHFHAMHVIYRTILTSMVRVVTRSVHKITNHGTPASSCDCLLPASIRGSYLVFRIAF